MQLPTVNPAIPKSRPTYCFSFGYSDPTVGQDISLGSICDHTTPTSSLPRSQKYNKAQTNGHPGPPRYHANTVITLA
ncbi:hypothetical protein N7519_008647 [Penicillium mononematosum]|uniref:uncharacterized protein n=1 Tax=Penicillium mononematosum TaxID=268346 RepID=UPI0025485A46|nr:uncharacterized protein N7519_008647 [Penicillium mononematosum]KAJ6178186.1 hypothetical protein N7519_008647 [Penicillium mononematosum]